MVPIAEAGNKQQMSWEQRLLKNAGKPKAMLKPEYQELKFTLHRKLLDKINLEAQATIDNQRVRSEVRQALITLIDSDMPPAGKGDEPVFSSDQIVLTLHDEGSDGRLFRMKDW